VDTPSSADGRRAASDGHVAQRVDPAGSPVTLPTGADAPEGPPSAQISTRPGTTCGELRPVAEAVATCAPALPRTANRRDGSERSCADPKDMSVRMADVHLADSPRLFCWRVGDLEARVHAPVVHVIEVFDEDRHPNAFVRCLIPLRPKRRDVRSFSTAALPSPAAEDLVIVAGDAREIDRRVRVRRIVPPLESGGPSELCDQLIISSMSETLRMGLTLSTLIVVARFQAHVSRRWQTPS
jgi:hypothetical protein